ncbi:MAG TPA: prolyl oligopeptidase family serine peptidase [Bacteroidia bacterium]|nr:prolyl oligopeptidase family serine peptidase [Bacteroidia bacterium]
MLRTLFLLTSGAIALSSCSSSVAEETGYTYPKTRKVDTVDTYFGVTIADPYRWLEDDNSDSTKKWVDEQNKVTFDYLGKITFRDKIRDRLKQVWNYEKRSAPYRRGSRYFYTRNDGMQNQSVLYYKESVEANEGKLLLDPNTLSADGTTSMGGWAVSHDGKFLQYALSKAGSDWEEFYVMNIETGEKLSDHLEWIKFSGAAWKNDGFFYGRFDEPKGSALSSENKFHKIFYHNIGDDQSKDQLIYKDDSNGDISFSPDVTDDQNWLIVYSYKSTHGNGLLVKDLSKSNQEFKMIVPLKDTADDYTIMDIVDRKMTIRTNHGAPNFKLVEVDFDHPEESNWKTVIPESENYMLGLSMAPNCYIAHYLVDVKSKLVVYDRSGKKTGEIPTGIDICSVNELSAHKKDSLVFIGIGTFTGPPSIYKYNLNTNKTDLYFQPKCDFKSDEYETEQVFFPSKDGTKVPMFVTHKKGIKMDGTNPCFLFGYGGFNQHYSPEFRIDRAVFLESGGVYAVANIRGGDEYGEKWHEGGILCNKQNVFDDFIAAGEFLIAQKYTSSEKLAVTGRSNGGLLIGAVETQRPDLFKVCIPQVGVLDMLRYHKFTIGRAWASDYGLSENEEQFKCLMAYSPLHNVKDANYPATLITTGDHDDRVVPAHSFKFAATMQEHQKGSAPVLIRIDKNAGHGAGKPTDKQIEEWADIWAFVFFNLGMTY